MNTNLQTIEMFPSIGSIEAYISAVNQIPMLSADEEQTLAQRFYKDSDLQAARALVVAHLRYVVRVAKSYSGYGLPQADLIQEGNIGLMKAVKRFNPDIGVRLVTFAVHWIKSEIHEFVIRNWRIVKIATTKAQRKLFFNLRQAKKSLHWLTHDEVHAVAKDLGVKPSDVREMEQRLSAQDVALLMFPSETNDDHYYPLVPVGSLEDQRYAPEVQLENHAEVAEGQKLHKALATLDERSQDILQRRWLADDKATLQELANKYQVSAERIRQLEQNAIKRLKETLQDEA